MSHHEQSHTVSVLLDIDGTTSNTAAHMKGLESRLVQAFPEVSTALSHVRAERKAFRAQYSHLSHVQQDAIWQQHYPNTSYYSHLDAYQALAPEVFTKQKTAEVHGWLSEPANFGYAEYADVEPMMEGLCKIGALAALFTLGQTETSAGKPGWQTLKVASSPRFSHMRQHIAATLPEGGKGQVINESYDQERDQFRFDMTDQLGGIVTNNLVMVDDSIHNLHITQPGLGILIDRQGRHSEREYPSNIHVVQSLEEVPVLVETYVAGRQSR